MIHPFASLGGPPQSVHYHDEPTELVVGTKCQIREHVTINLGTVQGGGGITTVGDNCFLMAGSHVGHDCRVGNNVTLANQTMLGGHCEIGDYTFIGGSCAVHQHVRLGEGVMVGLSNLRDPRGRDPVRFRVPLCRLPDRAQHHRDAAPRHTTARIRSTPNAQGLQAAVQNRRTATFRGARRDQVASQDFGDDP